MSELSQTDPSPTDSAAEEKSFAETALQLGGPAADMHRAARLLQSLNNRIN